MAAFFSSQHLVELITNYGYHLIFALIFLSNMGLPVPDETTVLLAGALAGNGTLEIRWVYPVCLVAAVLGDNAGYWIGRKGGRPLILRYGRRLGITENRFTHFERYFADHGTKTVFIGRFVAGLRVLAGPMSGAAHMPFPRFFAANALGAALWVLVITQIGYHFGDALRHGMERAKWIILALALLGIAFVVWKKWKKKEPLA